MAPNLGWVDVPLGARLARGAVGGRADHRRQRRRPRRARRAPARARRRRRRHALRLGRGRRRRRRDRRRPAARPASAGYGGEIGHLPVNPGGAPCRCGSIGCWETEVGEGALLALAGLPPDAGRAGIDAVLREAEAGTGTRVAALEHVGRWLGIGLAGLVNILNPRLVILGGPNGRLYPLVRDAIEAELDPVRAAGARGRSSASCRRRSGSTRRWSAPPRWPSIPCSPIRRPGSADATPPSSWRPPDGDFADLSSTPTSPGKRRLA